MIAPHKLWAVMIASAIALVSTAATCLAQDEENTEEKIPAPRDVVLETKDGVALHCTFYGGFLEKEAIPFLLLHGWDGNRGEFDGLAKELQRRGHASLAIDLRGHGDSVRFKAKEDTRMIDRTRFTGPDIDRMLIDLEAAKSFLIDRNNDGELNIESLAIIAAREGAVPAIKWTVADWNVRDLPSLRQGHDVKALFLLSPVIAFKGSNAQPVLTDRALNSQVAIFIAVGKRDSKAVADAKRLYSTFSQYRKDFSGDSADIESILKQEPKAKSKLEVFYDADDTNLAGTKLIGVQGLKVFGWMLRFIKLDLVDRGDEFEWAERRRL